MEASYGDYVLRSNLSTEIENLCKDDQNAGDGLKRITKEIYDHAYKCNKLTNLKSKAHKKLLVDGFDCEQIFQQLELENKSVFEQFNSVISLFDDSKYENDNYALDDSNSKNNDYVFDDSESSEENFVLNDSTLSIQNDDIIGNEIASSSDEENDVMQNKSKSKTVKLKNKKNNYKSPVDDKFFKLSNLEEFLKIEDMKAEDKITELDDSEDDVDYYQDNLSDFDDIEDELEIKAEKNAKDIMYEDFFDPPLSEEESNAASDNSNLSEDPSDVENEEDEELLDETLDENKQILTPNETDKTNQTPFQLEQAKVSKTISNYEDSLLQKPEWHLTGEIAAESRPKDSLLHQDTDFDVNAKPVLIEDGVLNEKIERSIKTIIKNKAYSDGQRQVKPTTDVVSLKKDIILEQSKSKKSLAEVYADEYLKKKYGEEEKENPKHQEIKKLMDSLLPELQALFCHIPKPAIPDIKIVSNLPAVTVEEVAPTSISDVTLLAPEEIRKKTGLVKGISERDTTDKKRERRKKKIHQRLKFKRSQSEDADKPPSAKTRKLEKIENLKKVKQNRNTKIATIGEDKIKSSKDFFSRLQEKVNATGPYQHKKKK